MTVLFQRRLTVSKNLYVVHELRGWSNHGAPGFRSMDLFDEAETYQVGQIPDNVESPVVIAAGVTEKEAMALIKQVPAKAYAWAVAGKVVESGSSHLSLMKMAHGAQTMGIYEEFRAELVKIAIALESSVLDDLIKLL